VWKCDSPRIERDAGDFSLKEVIEMEIAGFILPLIVGLFLLAAVVWLCTPPGRGYDE